MLNNGIKIKNLNIDKKKPHKSVRSKNLRYCAEEEELPNYTATA